jgi:hypothetical protein
MRSAASNRFETNATSLRLRATCASPRVARRMAGSKVEKTSGGVMGAREAKPGDALA